MLLFSYYICILFSVLGYGIFTSRNILKIDLENLGYTGFIGIFFLVIFSYVISQFIPHYKYFNLLIIIFGIILFFKFFKFINQKKNILLLLSIFVILFIFILVGKNHDDFHYYHFPYTYLLTEYVHPIGIGSLNHGFKTHSSLFFLSSLFYLPKIDYHLFHIAPVFFLGFANIIFIKKIFDKKNYEENNFIRYLNLLFFIFFNIFFYRLAEHGTDRSAMIIIVILVLDLLLILNNNLNPIKNKNQIYLLIILLSLAASLKAFYIIYFVFGIPIILYLKTKENFLLFALSRTTLAACILIFFVLLTNFFNTGCFLFPETLTCVYQVDWSLSENLVNELKIHYENWSKGGANPNFKVNDPSLHIKNFNWLSIWINEYFFNKVFDLLLGLITIVFIFCILFIRKKNIIISRNFYLVYLIIFILFIEWFLVHPALRYGGYHLLALLIFIPLSIILERFSFNVKQFDKKIYFIIFLAIIIFLSRNISRISNENDRYSYNPYEDTNYLINETTFKIADEMSDLIKEFENCKIDESKCKKNSQSKIKKRFNRYIFILK